MTEQVKPTISTSGVLEDLKSGLTRDDIKAKYGISNADMKVLFQNPHLKNKKTRKPKELGFILVDDISDESAAQSAENEVPEEQATSMGTFEEEVTESNDVFDER